jgi:hypothetical protein
VVEKLSPDGADQPFDERVGAGHEGYGLDLVNFEYPQVRWAVAGDVLKRAAG